MALFDSQQFWELVGGDKELAQSLVQLFEQDWLSLRLDCQQKVDQGDAKGLVAPIHKLKGNLRNFYAGECAEWASRMEDEARLGQMSFIKEKFPELVGKTEQLIRELRQFLASK